MAAVETSVDRARALVDDHVRVEVLGWERSGRYPRELAAASGLTALFVPEPAGGLGLSYPDGMRVFEQLGRGDAAFAFSLSMHNAVAAALHGAGSPELIATWGERLRTGNALGGFSLTEPQAGSDATAITTVADRDGQGWRVTGRKAWVSLAGEADLFLVVCHTGEGAGHRDIAIMAVDGRRPASRSRASTTRPPRRSCRSARCCWRTRLRRSWCRQGRACGRRWPRSTWPAATSPRSRQACTRSRSTWPCATPETGRRSAERVLDFQGIRWMLADAATELEASRLLVAAAAERLGTPEGPAAVAHAKRFAPDAALRAAIACSEVLGAYGWLNDHPLARFIALAKMLQVVDGTAEVQRLVIARDLDRRAEEL